MVSQGCSIFIRNPPPPLPIIKDDVFSKWVLGFFLQRWEQNFDPLDTNFSKMLTKDEPFDFHCSKGADKNLRVHIIPVILSGRTWTIDEIDNRWQSITRRKRKDNKLNRVWTTTASQVSWIFAMNSKLNRSTTRYVNCLNYLCCFSRSHIDEQFSNFATEV